MDEKDKPIPHDYEFFSDLLYIYKNYNIVTPDMEKQLSNLKKNYHIEESEEDDFRGYRALFFHNEIKDLFLKEVFDWGVLEKGNLSLIRSPSYKGLGHCENILKYQIEPSTLIQRTLETYLKIFSSYSRKYFYTNDKIRTNEKDGDISYKGLPGSIIWNDYFWKSTEKTYLEFESIDDFSLRSDLLLPLMKALGIKFHGIGMPDDETGNSVKIFFEKDSSPFKIGLEIKVDKLSVYVKNIDLYKTVGSDYLKNEDTKCRTFPLAIKSPESNYFILGKKSFINDPQGFKNGMILLSHKEGHNIRELIILIDKIFENNFSWEEKVIDLKEKSLLEYAPQYKEKVSNLAGKELSFYKNLDRRLFSFLNDHLSFQKKLN